MRGRIAVAALVTAACAASRAPTGPGLGVGPGGCQPVDSLVARWRATVFIDGRRVGDHLLARRESADPETFELTSPEPPPLAALPAGDLDLVQFSRGADPEKELALCPGYVAILVTTKRPR